MKQILTTGHAARHLIRAIAPARHNHIVHIFTTITRLWLDCVIGGVQSDVEARDKAYIQAYGNLKTHAAGTQASLDFDDTFYDRERTKLFAKVFNVESALTNVLKFFVKAAHESEPIRRGMIEAGALSIVLSAFVSADFLCHNLVSPGMGTRKAALSNLGTVSPIPVEQINQEASTLTILIQKPTFRQSWDRHQLDARRKLCAVLVTVLLRSHEELDSKHLWTLALLKKITAS